VVAAAEPLREETAGTAGLAVVTCLLGNAMGPSLVVN